MRKFLLWMVVLAVAAPAFAMEFVTNGDFETGTLAGWQQWGPIGWGSGTVDLNTNTPHGGTYQLRIRALPQGSLGLKQWVEVPTDQELDFSCWVRTGSNDSNWAEVLLYDYKVTNDADIDSGTASAPYMIWKRDSWGGVSGLPGGNLPTIDSDGSGWEHVTDSITSSTGWVTIAFKWGDGNALNNTNLRVDDVSLVPEPATALLLGLPLVLIRRRRLT